jgi:endonuclease YncB( thermonuclease family)
MTKPNYTFRVIEIVKVVDGDTAHLRLDLGLQETHLKDIRLLGWDTPEINSGSEKEKAAGAAATKVAYAFLHAAIAHPKRTVWVQTKKDSQSFNRYLGDIWVEDPSGGKTYLGEHLENLGLAVKSPNGDVKWRDIHDKETAGSSVTGPEPKATNHRQQITP